MNKPIIINKDVSLQVKAQHMKAIVYNKKQTPNKLTFCDVDKPVPSENEVLIHVFYASVNAADYRSMQMNMIPKGKIFGSAISGKIELVGENVSRFKPGDEVLGDLSDYGFGGFAEYALAPENALTLKPAEISFPDAATLPVAATTALKAIRDKGNVQENQQVLIVGSAGGVGSFAVQLAKYYGAITTGVCSTKNVLQTKTLGADHVIDYTQEDFTQTNERYDLIIAINGSYPLTAYKKLLKPKGTYIMVGGELPQILKSIVLGWTMSFSTKKMRFLSAKTDPKDLEFVAKLMAKNQIKPVIEKTFLLESTGQAMQHLTTGHAQGKVIVEVA